MAGDPPEKHKEKSAGKEVEEKFVFLSENAESEQSPKDRSYGKGGKGYFESRVEKIVKHAHLFSLWKKCMNCCCSTRLSFPIK